MTLTDLLIVILLISWIGGYSYSFGGALIHLLLIVALVLIIARLLPPPSNRK